MQSPNELAWLGESNWGNRLSHWWNYGEDRVHNFLPIDKLEDAFSDLKSVNGDMEIVHMQKVCGIMMRRSECKRHLVYAEGSGLTSQLVRVAEKSYRDFRIPPGGSIYVSIRVHEDAAKIGICAKVEHEELHWVPFYLLGKFSARTT